MGRPRKEFDRLTRTITARVQDEQYDWLVQRAAEDQGDLSKALRDAIDSARVMDRLLHAKDPEGELKAMLEREEPPEEEELA
jgi:uncharacterized protein (DUF1778 family)